MTCWTIICTYVELRKFVKVALCTWQDVISLSRAVSTQNWPPAILCLARIAKSIISATNKRYNICFLWEWILRVLTLHGCNIVVSSNFIRMEKYIFVFYECTFELILNVNSVTVLQLQIKLKKYTSAWTGCDSAGAQFSYQLSSRRNNLRRATVISEFVFISVPMNISNGHIYGTDCIVHISILLLIIIFTSTFSALHETNCITVSSPYQVRQRTGLIRGPSLPYINRGKRAFY